MTETVFITGAGKGVGFALASCFLQAGFQVFAGTHSPPPDISALAHKFPETLTVIPLDVSDMESIRSAVQRVSEKTSKLDILVNNAGVNLQQGTSKLEALDLADLHLEETFAVNTFGPLRVTQQLYPLLAHGERKLILNISSEAGSITDCGRGNEFAYCMSKSALNMQSKLLQNYLGPQGFKVLAVHPGWVRTDMGGPQAHISAEESAAGIFKLALRDWAPDDMIYLDYQGNALAW